MIGAAEAAELAVSVLKGLKLEAEAYLEESLVSSVAVSSGRVESMEMKEEVGAGLRVFEGGCVGFAHTSDLSAEGIRAAAAAARSLASHTDPDPAAQLPAPPPTALPEPETGDAGAARVEMYRKTALARAMEEAARAVDPRIAKIRMARYTDVVGRVEVRTTAGLARGAPFARIYGSIEVVAEQEGESQSGYANDFALRFAALDPFKIGREAARRALAKLGGRRPATRRADVVLDPEVTGSLLEAFGPAFAADNVLKGKSLLAGRIGQRAGAACVDLVDDGRFPGGNRTMPFDAEGAATARTVLIQGGVLKGYLHNWYSATKMGVAPTGNAFRSSYMGPPRIAPTTLYLIPSATPREDVIRGVEDGFYVSEVMGLHTVDTITGEFSLGASGHTVERGAMTGPVSGLGLAGNILEFLGSVAMVGSDLRLLPSGAGGSTILVRNLSVSGS